MAPPLLTLESIVLSFGGEALFSDVTMVIGARERIALVGRNGSGKSTLMKIIAGAEQGGIEPDQGVRFVNPGATILYLPQEPDFSGFHTVEDYLTAEEAGFSDPVEMYEVTPLLEELGVSVHQKIESLSGGEARKVALVRALVRNPDILMLDEPTNHLDIAAIEWLETRLRQLRGSLLLISHDRQFLENLTNKTVWLDRGKVRARDAGFIGFEEWRDKVLEEEALEHHKLGRKIAAEEDWVRYGVTARRKRNVRRMKELQELREAHKTARKAPQNVNFSVNQSTPSGKVVIEAENICKSFGEQIIVNDFSVRIARGQRIGLVGYNGAGKTTLLNMLTGALQADKGAIKIGTALDIVSLDQRRDSLKPGMRVADAITDGRGDFITIGESRRHVTSYLKDFLFAPEQWRSPVEALSGGERGRLALAAALAKPSNLLVLDEPTNDLDLETLDLLQDMLGDYQGTLILVSHDRSFLDRTVTSVIARNIGDPAGEWTEYAGGYSDMCAQRSSIMDDKKLSLSKAEKTKSKRNDQQPSKTQDIEASSGETSRKRDAGRSKKLSYKEKFALENLPDRIAELENNIAEFRTILAPADLFSRDPQLFSTTVRKLEDAETELATAEEEWLTLEMKREMIEESGNL